MSGSNRPERTSTVIGCSLIAAAVLTIAMSSFFSCEFSSKYAQPSAKIEATGYGHGAHDDIQINLDYKGSDHRRTISIVHEPTDNLDASQNKGDSPTQTDRKEQREKRGLQVQIDMATYALWMMRAAWVTTIVTAIGIILLALTLKYTKAAATAAKRAADSGIEMLDEAKQSNIRTLQPHLEITDFDVKWAGIHEGYGWIDIYITVKNIGKTPAIEFSDVCITDANYQIIPKDQTSICSANFDYFFAPGMSRVGRFNFFNSGEVLTCLSPGGFFHLHKSIGMEIRPSATDRFRSVWMMPAYEHFGKIFFPKPTHKTHFWIRFEFWFKDTLTSDDRGCRGFISQGDMVGGHFGGFSFRSKNGEPFMILLEDGRLTTTRGADAEYRSNS